MSTGLKAALHPFQILARLCIAPCETGTCTLRKPVSGVGIYRSTSFVMVRMTIDVFIIKVNRYIFREANL